MKYIEYKPHPALSEYVECFWSTDVTSAISPRDMESFIPDGNIELVFNFGDPHTEVKNGKKECVKDSHISGIQSKSSHVVLPGRLKHFCVRFKPGGSFPFLGIPTHLFANSNYPLDILLGKEYLLLEEQIFEAPNDTDRIKILENFLLNKLSGTDFVSDYRFVKSCINSLLLPENPLKINDLGKLYSTNYKTIERKFKKIIGLSPSELLKIKQINNAVRHMYHSANTSLTEVAYASGYYDQSHFIREFKQITNLTPREFRKKQFALVCTTEQNLLSCRTVVEIVQFLQVTDSYVCLEN